MVKNRNLTRWVFVLPAIIIVGLLFVYPFFSSIYFSFTNKHLIMPRYKFVGLANYKAVLSDPNFYNAFFNSLKWTVFSLVGQVLVGFVLALALHRVRRFKKLYRMIGIGIFVIGAILALFLPYIIKGYPINREVYIIYFLFVFNSSSSYFFSYKRTLLYVDQRNYVMTLIDFGLYLLRILLQIGVLIYTKNFVIYLLVSIFINILGNLIMSSIVDRMYEYLFSEEITPINEEEKSKFVKNIKGNIVGGIGETIVFQTDSLLMGAYISLTAIGLYGNYIFVLGFLEMAI